MTPLSGNNLKQQWFLPLLLLLLCGLYVFNISGWLIHDDEGTDLYEAWQLQIGNQPGVDFIAEQQPLFLLLGKIVLGFSDDSVQSVRLLRLVSALQVLSGAFFFGWAIRKIWGNHTAALTVGLILTSGLVYQQARLFRPDPMMFAWELFGLGFVMLAVYEGKRPYWAAAGFCYGVAILMKPFGLFPILGLIFFFAYQFYTQRDRWSQIFANGLAFAIPLLLTALGISAILYAALGFYYLEFLAYHVEMGEQRSLLNIFTDFIFSYIGFFLIHAVTIFILPLAYLSRRHGLESSGGLYKALLLTQLVVPLSFVAISRPLHPRYFMFLVPVVALLLALEVNKLFSKITLEQPRLTNYFAPSIFVFIAFSALTTWPSISQHLTRKENDTLRLAQFIQTNTAPDDVVVADYAALNFHARRQSIHEASIIAGGQIDSGAVTGALLIDRLEASEAELILIHVEGGDPFPHHIIDLIDFPVFEAYLAEEYEMIELFDRGGQLIEIYQRK